MRETAVKFLEHDLRPLLPDGAWSTDRVDLVPQFPRHDRRFLRKVAAQQLQLADEVLPAGVGAHEFGHIVGKPAVIFPVDRVFKACRSGEKFCVRPGIQASKMFQREFDPYVVRFGDVDQRMEVGEFVLREEAGVFRLQLKERDPHPDADEIAAVLGERNNLPAIGGQTLLIGLQKPLKAEVHADGEEGVAVFVFKIVRIFPADSNPVHGAHFHQ